MKVLIVDDEKHVVDAIKLLIDWEKFNIRENDIYEAYDGKGAIKVITEQHPEIIFTDMKMPEKDGYELLNWITDNSKRSKVIAVSGYSDFHYVRHAMKCGGIDYVLKPIDLNQINEAFEIAVESWKNNMDSIDDSSKVSKTQPVYRAKLLSDIIRSKSTREQINKIATEFQLPEETHKCRVIVVQVQELTGEIHDQYENDKELLFFSINNVCNELIQNNTNGYSFRNIYVDNEVVIFTWGLLEDINKFVFDVYSNLTKLFGNHFIFGIGEEECFLESINKSYTTASLAIFNRNLKDYNKRIHKFTSKNENRKHFNIIMFQDKLIFAIKSVNKENIRSALNELEMIVEDMEIITAFDIEQYIHQYYVTRENIISQLFLNRSHKNEYSQFSDVSILKYTGNGFFSITNLINQIESDLIAIMNVYNESLDSNEDNTITKIKEYIELNFTDKISLNQLSDMFYLSKEHISRSFKKVTGKTMSDYITDIKMEKCKLLLENPKYNLAEIAEMVGYDDAKYFSKVFKKKFNMSPKQYRNH